MNERIDELMIEAGARFEFLHGVHYDDFQYKKFAELIVRECKENFAKVWYKQGVDCRGAELDKFMAQFDQHFGVEE